MNRRIPSVGTSWRLCLLSSLLLASAVVIAQPPQNVADSGGVLDLLANENKVYAASRYVQSLDQTPANVTILVSDELRKYGYRSVTDALTALPGVYNTSNLAWRTLGIRGFGVPGDFNSRFVYLINGMPINEPIFGGTLTCQIDMESVERIEFVRGPGSAVYGDGAILGVFNIITRSGSTVPGKVISAGVGNQDTHKVYGSYGSVAANGLDTFVSLSYAQSSGVDVYFPEYDNPPASDGLSTGNNDMDVLRLFGRIAKKDRWIQWHLEVPTRNDPQASYGTDFDSNQLRYKDRTVSLEMGERYRLANEATLTARGFILGFKEVGEYPYSFNPSIYINNLSSAYYGADLQYERYFGAGHRLIAGLEAKQVEAKEVEGLVGALNHTGFDKRYWHYGLFSQAEIQVASGKRIFIGARYDHLDGYASEQADNLAHLSPRLGYVHEFSTLHTGKLLFGEAFRAATVMEAYYGDRGFSQIENLRLEPEIARTFEAVWERRLDNGSATLSGYITQLSHSIVAVDASANPACKSGQCKQYQNIAGLQKVRGVEAAFNIKQAGKWRAYGSATSQRATQPPDDYQAPASPRMLLKLGATHPLPWRIDGALEAQHVGKMQGILLNYASELRTEDVPAYTVVNAALTGLVRQKWRLSLRIDNLFDRKVLAVAPLDFAPIERIPINQRRVWMKVTHNF